MSFKMFMFMFMLIFTLYGVFSMFYLNMHQKCKNNITSILFIY